MLGLACHHDPRGDLDRAARHYERSLAQAPEQVRCLGEAGLLAILRGDDEQGLTCSIVPSNSHRTTSRPLPASARACASPANRTKPNAKFGWLSSACRAAALRQLSADLLLDRLRRRQDCDASEQGRETQAVILPFLQVVGSENGAIRLHNPEPVRGPHLSLMRVAGASAPRREVDSQR